MVKLNQITVRCLECNEIVNGRPNSETSCHCGDVSLNGVVVDLAKGSCGIVREQWVDDCTLIAEGTPEQCNHDFRVRNARRP